jgi:hypothetical protein
MTFRLSDFAPLNDYVADIAIAYLRLGQSLEEIAGIAKNLCNSSMRIGLE